MALDLRSNNWSLVGSLSYPTGTAGALRGGLLPTFSKRLVKVKSRVQWPETPDEGERWRRCGWCYQTTLEGLEITSRECYVNLEHLLIFPLLTDRYYMGFLPVRWLPNLEIEFWQYAGDETQAVDEFIFMLSGI